MRFYLSSRMHYIHPLAYLAALVALVPVAVRAQQMRFPSRIVEPDPYIGAPADTSSLGPISQPPVYQWDPYATTPYTDPFGPPSSAPAIVVPDATGSQPAGGLEPQRFLQDYTLSEAWIYGRDGDLRLQINDVEMHATATFPFFQGQPPLKLTPGFAFHLWDGPATTVATPFELPPVVYDAYLTTGWEPEITERFKADLSVTVGAFGDFQFVSDDTIRIRGKGMGVYSWSPNLQIVGGVWYIDRDDIKVLPAGGVIWTRTPDTIYHILFPNPKVSCRWTTVGTTEWWWYVEGEYGGGAWSIERTLTSPGRDTVDYSDLRILGGLEWKSVYGCKGFFEVGYVFNRKVRYRVTADGFDPQDSVVLGAGVAY